ncbi:MAG TPA: single-stranded DNA-binding protein [Candidatus Dormibacteraeota bacterium]
MINKVILIGRLAADPDVRLTQQGMPVTNLRLVTNTYSGKDDSGNKKEHSEFHRLVLFGRPAEVAGEYLKKGRQIYAEGRLQTRDWTDGAGVRHFSTEVVVDQFQMLGPKPNEESEAA